MDQPISCQDICHIYKHPLSILIHLKFQDKDGCSRNGSRELLFEITELERDPTIKSPLHLDHFRYKSDMRGVAYMIYLVDEFEEMKERIKSWKSCEFSVQSSSIHKCSMKLDAYSRNWVQFSMGDLDTKQIFEEFLESPFIVGFVFLGMMSFCLAADIFMIPFTLFYGCWVKLKKKMNEPDEIKCFGENVDIRRLYYSLKMSNGNSFPPLQSIYHLKVTSKNGDNLIILHSQDLEGLQYLTNLRSLEFVALNGRSDWIPGEGVIMCDLLLVF